MRRTCIPSAVSLAIAILMLAVTTPASAFDFLQMCKADVQTHCSTVKPGDGRLLACLYAHEDKLTKGCDELLSVQLDQVDWFMEDMRASIAACVPDLKVMCADAPVGGGAKRACLMEKRKQASPECQGAIAKIEARVAN